MFHSEKDLLANLIDLRPKTARKHFRKSIFESWNYKCAYCEEKLSDSNATLDHIVPKYKGGHSTRNNLACCCTECNRSKASRLPFDWFDTSNQYYSEQRLGKLKQWIEQKPSSIKLNNSFPTSSHDTGRIRYNPS